MPGITTDIQSKPKPKTRPEPIGYSINDTCAATSLGRTKIYDLINKGKLETIRIGSRTIVKVESVRQLMEAA